MPTRVPPPAVAQAALALRRGLRRLADAVVPAPLAVFEDAVGLGTTMALATAVELRLADRLQAGPRAAADLAAEAGADPDSLARLLRALVSGGYFTRLADGRFANNRRSAVLRHAGPGSLADFIAYFGSVANIGAWADFAGTVRTGRNAFERVHGVGVWDWFSRHPAEGAVFAGAMGELTRLAAPALAVAYPWGELGRVCDVAGGRGALLAELCTRHPALTAILFDAPALVAAARQELAAAGLADRVDCVAGDLFGALPAGADAYILKEILHDWDDAQALAILQGCRQVMATGARILVLEIVVEPAERRPPGPWIDLHMMTVCAEGRQRSRADFARLFEAAGLRLARVLPSASPMSIVEGQAV